MGMNMQVSGVIDSKIFKASNKETPIRVRQPEVDSLVAVRVKFSPLFLVKFNIYKAKKWRFESARWDLQAVIAFP